MGLPNSWMHLTKPGFAEASQVIQVFDGRDGHMSEYTFRLEHEGGRTCHLVYEELNRRLDVYLEMSGVPQFEWLGCEESFTTWTAPAGQPIAPEGRGGNEGGV